MFSKIVWFLTQEDDSLYAKCWKINMVISCYLRIEVCIPTHTSAKVYSHVKTLPWISAVNWLRMGIILKFG